MDPLKIINKTTIKEEDFLNLFDFHNNDGSCIYCDDRGDWDCDCDCDCLYSPCGDYDMSV